MSDDVMEVISKNGRHALLAFAVAFVNEVFFNTYPELRTHAGIFNPVVRFVSPALYLIAALFGLLSAGSVAIIMLRKSALLREGSTGSDTPNRIVRLPGK